MRCALFLSLLTAACSATTHDALVEPQDVRSELEQDQVDSELGTSISTEQERESPPPDRAVPPALQPDEGILAADVPRRVEEGWTGMASIVPTQRWPQLPGRVVGVLFAAGSQPWGGSIDWMHGIELEREYYAYRFCVEGSSPHAIYFTSDGRGHNFMRQWAVPTPQGSFSADVAMYSPATANDWGLSRRAHLVELEVNGGQGGEGIHFIVTSARVLDESSSFPPAMEAVLIALRQRFDRFVEERGNELEQIVAREGRALEQQGATIIEQHTDRIGLWPSWQGQDQTLAVTFVRRFIRAAETPQNTEQTGCPPCPPSRQCPPCLPRAGAPARRQSFGAEMAEAFVVDHEGTLVSDRVFPPRAIE